MLQVDLVRGFADAEGGVSEIEFIAAGTDWGRLERALGLDVYHSLLDQVFTDFKSSKSGGITKVKPTCQ